jgi:3-methyl-2-oxobutanoate hydroxymethyltransferase
VSSQVDQKRITPATLKKMRARQEKIAVLTAYDASFAALCESENVDVLIVGDSLGMVLQGRDSTLHVTVQDIAYHVQCVARGCRTPLIIADMPFASYHESQALAFRNAAMLMRAGAQMVKLEGGVEVADVIRFLVTRGIPVCGHIGLTPQSVSQLGGYRVQGRSTASADGLLKDATALAAAGASLLVLEAITETVTAEIVAALTIPTIGIGASVACAGQVLVLHDMLDISPNKKAKFVKNFMEGQPSIAAAIGAFVTAVKNASFPGPEHCY